MEYESPASKHAPITGSPARAAADADPLARAVHTSMSSALATHWAHVDTPSSIHPSDSVEPRDQRDQLVLRRLPARTDPSGCAPAASPPRARPIAARRVIRATTRDLRPPGPAPNRSACDESSAIPAGRTRRPPTYDEGVTPPPTAALVPTPRHARGRVVAVRHPERSPRHRDDVPRTCRRDLQARRRTRGRRVRGATHRGHSDRVTPRCRAVAS